MRPENGQNLMSVHIVFDACSQYSYICRSLKEEMNLVSVGKESLLIKTLGEHETKLCNSEVAQVGIRTSSGEIVDKKAFSVPVICGPLSHQPIDLTKTSYEHLRNLNLAEDSSAADELPLQMLIGADYYWSLVNGTVVQGKQSEPVALSTKLGYVLSRPTAGNLDSPNTNSVNLTPPLSSRLLQSTFESISACH